MKGKHFQTLFGVSYRKAKAYEDSLRKKLGKKENQFLSVGEVSQESGIPYDEILKSLGRLAEDDSAEEKN